MLDRRWWPLACLVAWGAVGAQSLHFDFEAPQVPEAISIAGDAGWTIDDTSAFGGLRSLRAELLSAGQSTRFGFAVDAPEAMLLTFGIRVDSPWWEGAGYIYADGDQIRLITDTDWKSESLLVPPGTRHVQFEHAHGNEIDPEIEGMWVDDIRIEPLVTATERASVRLERSAVVRAQDVLRGRSAFDIDGDGRDELLGYARSVTEHEYSYYWYVADVTDDGLRVRHAGSMEEHRPGALRAWRDGAGQVRIAVAAGRFVRVHDAMTFDVLASHAVAGEHSLVDLELVDVDGDGDQDVIVLDGTGDNDFCYPPGCDATVTALDLGSGEVLWNRKLESGARQIALVRIDAARTPAIIVGTKPGYALDVESGATVWEYADGFWEHLAVLRDRNSGAERLAVGEHAVRLFDLATRELAFTYDGDGDVVGAVDVDGDARDELLVLMPCCPRVEFVSPWTGEVAGELEHVDTRDLGQPAVGDFDGDGVRELVIGSWYGLRAITLSSEQPFRDFVAEGNVLGTMVVRDVDGDADPEIFYGLDGPGRGRFGPAGSVVRGLRAGSLAEFVEFAVPGTLVGFDIGQLDPDAGMELLAVYHNGRDYLAQVIDVASGTLEREIGVLHERDLENPIGAIFAATILGPGRFAVQAGSRIFAVNGTDGTLLAESEPLLDSDAVPSALRVVDTDADGVDELLVVDRDYVATFDPQTLAVQRDLPLGADVAAVDTVRGLVVGVGWRDVVTVGPDGDVLARYEKYGTKYGLFLADVGDRRIVGTTAHDGVLEAFDLGSGRRLAANWFPVASFGRGGVVHRLPDAGGRPVYVGLGEYGVHQVSIDIGYHGAGPLHVFGDGFDVETSTR